MQAKQHAHLARKNLQSERDLSSTKFQLFVTMSTQIQPTAFSFYLTGLFL